RQLRRQRQMCIRDSHDTQEHEEHGHSHELDPHVWLDPALAIKEVETIRNQLSKKYPDDKAAFEKNAASYIDAVSYTHLR
ncbi:zinc ABC transporter substrate-binding protein, partial [Enterococcus sp. S181_ASV_20]|nr:zinc ABC transporter substrate-binding protein [Enterococcus sp. S181_ASV_20]